MPRPAVDAVGRHHRTPRHWSLGQTAHEKWIFLRRGPRRAVSPVMRPGPAGRSPGCPACRAEEHRVVEEGAFLAIGLDAPAVKAVDATVATSWVGDVVWAHVCAGNPVWSTGPSGHWVRGT